MKIHTLVDATANAISNVMTIVVGKIEVSDRQLNEAVQMWLDARDPFAIHTVAMAGFGVLKDLHKFRFPEEATDPLRNLLSQISYNEFNKISNFLKHADRDPDTNISVPDDRLNESRIGICLTVLRCLGRPLTPTLGAFHLMSLMTYPEQFRIAPDSDPDIEFAAKYWSQAAQNKTDLRREQVRIYIKLMESGIIPTDINWKRIQNDG
jgi:hypothetical protein